MSSAGLLNGLILNGTLRYTFAGCVVIAGQANAAGSEPTRVVLPAGTANAYVEVAPTQTRKLAYVQSSTEAGAAAPALDAWKITNVSAEGMLPEAVATGTAIRNPYLYGSGEAQADSTVDALKLSHVTSDPAPADRTLNGLVLNGGWYEQSNNISTADIGLTSVTLTTRIIPGVSDPLISQADLTPLAYDLTRWMTPKPVIGRSLSFNHRSDVTKIKVNQQYNRGTAIGYADSRGLHSAILAKSLTEAAASADLPAEAVYVARDSGRSASVSEAIGSGVVSQKHDVLGASAGEAFAACSPDLILAGTSYTTAFAYGAVSAISQINDTIATRNPLVFGVRQPGWAESTGVSRQEVDVTGFMLCTASSESNPGSGLITHNVHAKSKAVAAVTVEDTTPVRNRLAFSASVATAEIKVTPWYWIAVGADSSSSATATVNTVSIERLGKVTAYSEVTAVASDTAYKQATMTGTAASDGATTSDAVAGLARRVNSRAVSEATIEPFWFTKTTSVPVQTSESTGSSGASYRNAAVRVAIQAIESEAVVSLPWADSYGMAGARHLRVIGTQPVMALASSGLGRNVYKINADSPAPDSRTVFVAQSTRTVVVQSSSREVKV